MSKTSIIKHKEYMRILPKFKNISISSLVITTILALFIVIPFIMMFLTSFKSMPEIFDTPNRTLLTRVLPDSFNLENYRLIITGEAKQLNGISFLVFIKNTFITSVGAIIPAILMSCLAAYGFSKFSFPGKTIFYYMLLMLLMIPMEMISIPLFQIVAKWGLVDTYVGIMLPGAISAFGIFLMKENYDTIPKDYIEAARIDGQNEFGIFFKIIVPMSTGAMMTFLVIKFTQNWNSYFWPLLVVGSEEKKTVTLGLSKFTSDLFQQWNELTAAVILSLLPTLLLFVIFKDKIVSGLMRSGLK
nr:carbohydrate ABC transporter permease [uncultured Sphaerochaeta sp.]